MNRAMTVPGASSSSGATRGPLTSGARGASPVWSGCVDGARPGRSAVSCARTSRRLPLQPPAAGPVCVGVDVIAAQPAIDLLAILAQECRDVRDIAVELLNQPAQ